MNFRAGTVLAVLSLLSLFSIDSLAQPDKGQPLFGQAIVLHAEGKHEEALAKIKEALTLVPESKLYLGYQAELNPLAARDKFDSHALQAPPEVEKTLDSLAKYLVEPAKTDRDKARLIFRWIADRIAYDTESFFAGKNPADTPETVLARRKALCGGYAVLFEALGKRGGLETQKILGHAKGIGFTPGTDVKKYPHAWNAVKIDGKWQVLDNTWGAGDLKGKEFRKQYKDYYFLPLPARLIHSHLPEDAKWQLLESPVSRDAFVRAPFVGSDHYALGLTDKQMQAARETQGFRDLVETFPYAGPKITLRAVPLDRHLKAGAKQRFEIEAPAFIDMALLVNGKAERMKREGSVFVAEVTPAAKGELLVGGATVNSPNRMAAILRYAVE